MSIEIVEPVISRPTSHVVEEEYTPTAKTIAIHSAQAPINSACSMQNNNDVDWSLIILLVLIALFLACILFKIFQD